MIGSRKAATLGVVFCLALSAAQAITLPRTIAEAQALERGVALPPSDLYTRSYALGGTEPGDLLAQEPYERYEVAGLGRAVRMTYRSEDVSGQAVVTSAMILLPQGSPPEGGWPVIAWGHGTSGVATACAPSLMRDAYYGAEGLADMLKAGLAVVATDYHGLGTPGPHLYINKPSQARDIIYSVPAARRAVPELGRRWVSDGHSQGGLASWGVAELESARADDNYLGSVSVSGAGSLAGLFQYILAHPKMTLYLPWATAGIQARYPQFEPQTILAPAVMKKYADVTTQGCWYYGYAAYQDTPPNTAFNAGWRTDPTVRRWMTENSLGAIRIRKPLLVISGEGDQTVPIAGVRQTVRRSCAAGSALAFKSYPGLDHDETMVESVTLQIRWIKDRFAGKAFESTCGGRAVP